MEDNQDHETDPMEGDSGHKINPEEWLYYLVQINGNEKLRNEIFGELAHKTGFSMEKVEVIMKSLMETLLNISRSN